jgi:hypothetical protein
MAPIGGNPGPLSPSDEVAFLTHQGADLIEQTAKAHHERWGLGSADRWDIDQEDALIRWTFSDRIVEAPVQALGSYGLGGTWLWAWANESILPALRSASEELRAWGEQRGQVLLATPELDVSAEQAADLASLAFRLAGATGFYRAHAGRSQIYVAFGVVKIVWADGRVEPFSINLD